MNIKISLLIIFLISGWNYNLSAQNTTYTQKESLAIHDSIQKSRWDIGGRMSKYSFRYMSEFFPTALISKADKPFQFQIKPSKEIEEIVYKSKKDTLSIEKYLRKLHISSFIVVSKGSIVYEKYFSMHPQDQHSLQSVTKVITSTIITSLINEKKIDADLSIEKYIPELGDSEWKGITVKDILNMRSGMDSASIYIESGPFTNPKHKNYQLESALGILPKAANTPTSVYEYIKQLKKDKPAGIAAEYSNINTFVLGWLAETVTGQRYSDLVAERIWIPMGATSNAYVCLSDQGIAWHHGGISATLRDLARFGMLYTKSDIGQRKESLISFAQLKEIFDAPPIDFPIPFKWAYQWDLASDGILMKSGFGGQALYIHPEKEIIIAYYNYVDEDWGIDNMISNKVINEIIKILDK